MSEYDDMNTYDGNAEHDMWVDFDFYMNTGEMAEYFDDDCEDYDEDEYDDDTF